MDKRSLLELVPHYVLMLLLASLVIGVVRSVTGDLGFWVEFVIIGVVVFGYRPVVRYLGVAPSAWEE